MRLSIAFMGNNPRVAPLVDGTVKPEGFDLDFREINNLYYDNLHFDQLDLAEMSISESFVAHERRDKYAKGKWDWSSIPIFLARGHGWTGLHVRSDSGIETPGDLRGKRVAVPDYEMTYAVWFRIVLKDMYGVSPNEIEWFNVRKEGESHGFELFLEEEGPKGVKLTFLKEGQDEYEMLINGELDAAPIGRNRTQDNPAVRPIVPERGKQLITDFYRQTGFHQPNHHFIAQNRLLAEHPWVARSLYDALKRSKEISYERDPERAKRDEGSGLGPEVFGEDPWPVGISAMRPTLERCVQGLTEQGLITQPVRLEDLYHESLWET
jgi:4,5-dihydroxyphthalate decarboxylase